MDAQVPTRLIVTGSSSFQLFGQIGEPLTGRKVTLLMLPVSHIELKQQRNPFELKEKIDEFLIFGMYPEVLTADSEREKTGILNEITGSYLLKDILDLERVKSSKVLLDLLRLVAFQYLCRIPRACPWMNAGGYFGTLERRWRHDFPVTACIGPSIMWYGYQNTGEGS